MVNRRSHKKSRAGCQQCKQRRIKCDETHPRCNGCIKRELDCIYSATPLPSTPVSTISSSKSVAPDHVADLKLIHHFTLYTYKTCDHGLMPLSWWQKSLPVMAFQEDHLLHAILSFTSLHVAYLRPAEAQAYVMMAENYRQSTLNRLAKVLPDIEPGQTQACFWSSTFVGMIALALPAVNGYEGVSPKEVLLGLSTLWRGAATVGKMSAAVTAVHDPASLPAAALSASTMPQLQDADLGSSFDKLIECALGIDSTPAELRDEYVKAIADMAEACAALESQGLAGGILAWFPCLDQSVIEAMVSDDVVTNLILIFYGVVLYKLKNVWYISNLGLRLVEELTPKIPLTYLTVVKLVNWARERVCQ
ncbi:hypothetical protein KJ359_004586 [Pestalotiopsis sp. 9143b]|nr:hypothetical protein KJ359_004586 [Pestalotiopsis sp. 9143b]